MLQQKNISPKLILLTENIDNKKCSSDSGDELTEHYIHNTINRIKAIQSQTSIHYTGHVSDVLSSGCKEDEKQWRGEVNLTDKPSQQSVFKEHDTNNNLTKSTNLTVCANFKVK